VTAIALVRVLRSDLRDGLDPEVVALCLPLRAEIANAVTR